MQIRIWFGHLQNSLSNIIFILAFIRISFFIFHICFIAAGHKLHDRAFLGITSFVP